MDKVLYSSYQEFNEHKAKCTMCSIGSVYNKVVCSDGYKQAKVLIIGEAPGKDEIESGVPFVGKAGKLLRKVLNEYGYRKNNSLITNTIPCRPQDNQFPKEELLVRRCMDEWLLTEISLVSPEYMLLIGATPMKYLLKRTGITTLRGQWFKFDHINCMPTYHPSYVLRKEHMKEGLQIMADFKNDIKTVAKKAGFITGE